MINYGAVNENSILEGRSRNSNPVFLQNGPGCFHNGTVYGEGSAMSTSSLCEYCYCIKGQQHCVRPQCVLAMPGCQPVFTKHSCCPIKYNCSSAESTTTSKPILQHKECSINGSYYQEGEMLTGLAKKCETCYCVQGKPRCEPVTCSVPSGAKKHCSPVYSNDHCCPTSYKCIQQNHEEMSKETRNYNSKDVLEDKTVDSASERKSHTSDTELAITTNNKNTTNINQTSSPKKNDPENSKTYSEKTKSTNSTERTVITTVESRTETVYVTTTNALTTEDYTTTSVYDVDYSSTFDSTEFSTTDVDSTTLDTVTTPEPFLPTEIPASTVGNDVNSTTASLKSNNDTSTTTVKSIPPELEAILNSTQNKEHSEDYDYDYNESSLPPSLPNLRIIPFVAADAVVAKTENSGANYQLPIVHGPSKPLLPTSARKPPYYKINHHNRFSPPTETEGGFLPKEPTLDHPLYDGKLEFPYHSVGFNIEITIPPVADQALPAPSSNLERMCIHNGKRYSSGDVVSEPLSCNICVCYYGEIICQEPKCSPVQTGCTRIHDPSVGCCGRIVCGTNDLDSPTRVIDRVDHMTQIPPSLHTHYSTSNLPAFTIADIVSTPDPFRDVIRTEPAPDLPSLIGEIIHLWDQTTQQYSTSSLPSITTGPDEENKVVSILESSDTIGSSYNNNNKMENSSDNANIHNNNNKDNIYSNNNSSSYNNRIKINSNRDNNNNKDNIDFNNNNKDNIDYNNNNKDNIDYNNNNKDNIDYNNNNKDNIDYNNNNKDNIDYNNNNKDNIDYNINNKDSSNNNNNKASNGIDRIDVGFTSSDVNEEGIYPTPIFKSNKTKTEYVDDVKPVVANNYSSPDSIILSTVPSKVVVQNINSKPPIVAQFPKVEPDSIILSAFPSKVVVQNVNSKPPIVAVIPKVEVGSKIESPVNLTGSNNVSMPKLDETSKSRTNITQSSSIEYVSVSSTSEIKSHTGNISSSTNNTSILSSTTPRVLESSPDSSFLFSTDDSDDVDDSEAELKNEESDYSDSFSLDSVFKFFFDSGTEASEASTVKLPASETVTPSATISTSRKPVSLKTPIFPVTTIKPTIINKTVTSSRIPTTTTRSSVKVSPIKNNYFSSRITAKPVKDIIHGSHKNVSTNHSKIDGIDENNQEINLKPNDHDIVHESDKLRTEKPIIYINRFHSVTNDHKNRNRTATRVPGTITRIPPSGTGNKTNGTGIKTNGTGIVTPGSSKVEVVRTSSNGTVNKLSSYGSINRTPGTVNRTVTGIIKPLNRVTGVYSRTPGSVSRISTSTTSKPSISTDEDRIQHISAIQPTMADPSAVTGLLKLAGCNIYGRMYRVGKIITELSGPCLECMCTEVGVQCRPLPC